MKKNWYKIKALAENRHEVRIYDEIGFWGVTAQSFIDELDALGPGDLDVRISSPGGSVVDGMAIHNALKRQEGTVRTFNDGLAASMASSIFMAGEERIVSDVSLIMIHKPWDIVAGDADELRKSADVLDKFETALIKSYSASNLTTEELEQALADETWMDSDEALAFGFATEIEVAEVDAQASFDLSKFNNIPKSAERFAKRQLLVAAAIPKEVTIVKDDNKAAQASAEDLKAAGQAAVAADREANAKRVASIKAKFGHFEGQATLMQECIDDVECSAEDAGTKLLDVLGKDIAPTQTAELVNDEADKRRQAAVDWLVSRSGKGNAGANPYRGMSLLDMARDCANRAGASTQGLDRMQTVQAAFTHSTSDFPIVLENTMHKVLLDAFAAIPDSWRQFCAIGTLADFRPHNRYLMGTFGDILVVNEQGEYENATISDATKETITGATKGRIMNISREMIVNDDLGAFTNIASSMGRGAARTIEKDVYALFALNGGFGPTLNDGNPVFHATHNNIAATDAVISVDSIDLARVDMASQMDNDANDFLDIRPQSLLCPISMGGDARVINDAQYDPDTPNKLQRPNKVRGLFSDIVDSPRLSGTAWYLFANASDAPVFEVAFLDGQQQPFLDSMMDFKTDGLAWKVRLDYGVAGIGYRGAVKNNGV